VLRRPATPADRLDAPRLGLGNEVAVDYVRRARVLPGGVRVYVIPALDAHPHPARRPERCFAREREALDHRLRGKPPQAQRAARRQLRASQRFERRWTLQTRRAGVFLLAADRSGGFGGGGGGAASLRKYGAFVSGGRRHQTLIVGLVPDGVARIDFTVARGHSIEPHGPTYRRVYRRTVAVVDSVVAFHVPRKAIDASVNRQVWRAADGSVVNVVPAPTAG
jgi:hypothetical protein